MKLENTDEDKKELERFYNFVKDLNGTRLKAMRNRVRALYDSHFSVNGAMNQLQGFLKYGNAGSDLRCTGQGPLGTTASKQGPWHRKKVAKQRK